MAAFTGTRIKLIVKSSFFAIYGRNKGVLVPADAPSPTGSYFQVGIRPGWELPPGGRSREMRKVTSLLNEMAPVEPAHHSTDQPADPSLCPAICVQIRQPIPMDLALDLPLIVPLSRLMCADQATDTYGSHAGPAFELGSVLECDN